RAARRPEGAHVDVDDVAVAGPAGLAGAVGAGPEAEVGAAGVRVARARVAGTGVTGAGIARPRVLRPAVAVRDPVALVGARGLRHDLRHAAGVVHPVGVRDAHRRGGLRVGAGGVVLVALAGPGHVVEDVAPDLPVAPLVGVEGAQDVPGVLEVVVLHLRAGPGTGVDAGLAQPHVVVVVHVRHAAAQQGGARVDVLVQVVVVRDVAVGAVALAGPDQAAAAGVAQDAVGEGDVLGVVLQVEEAVVALRLPTRGLQGDVVHPDVADVLLHPDGVTAVGGGGAGLLDVPDGHVLDDDVAGLPDVDAQLVEHGSAADADDRDVADLLELDHVVGGVATASRHLGGVAVVDGPFDLDDDRGAGAGPGAQALVDLGPARGPHPLSARAAGGATVLSRVPRGAAGLRRRRGRRQGQTSGHQGRSGQRRHESTRD